ncbi:MAG: T9SS type A sorting domain-containing protein, partial [Rhodothermales bacterium]
IRGIAFSKQGHVFAATYGGGIYRSVNRGDAWEPINGGLTNKYVLAFGVSPVDGTIYTGTNAGVYVNVHPEYTSADDESEIPTGFSLEQNYPNPFNPATNFAYDLTSSSEVRLEIFDLLGRRIATLVDRYEAAGRHVVSFDAGNLPGGAYVYRLSVADRMESRLMVLVK